MRNTFTSVPLPADMVTESQKLGLTALLCIECGWEGVAQAPMIPASVFRNHSCRLRTQQVSTSD